MLRAPDGKTEVSWVPRHQLSVALEVFKEFIYEGAEVSEGISLTEIISGLLKSNVRLGVIYKIDPFVPIGSWFSDIRIDNVQNYDYVTIYGLSGIKPNAWALGVAQLAEAWARDENCYSYRWYGRLGWLRYVKGAKLLETVNPRAGLFEKVIEL